MLFNAKAVLTNRRGKAMRDAKPDAKPTPGQPLGDDDLCDVLHGHICINALDNNLPGDEKALKDKPTEWVRNVTARDEISRALAAAMEDGADGWVSLKQKQIDLLIERLSMLAAPPPPGQPAPLGRNAVAVVGPIIHALENPPEKKPEPQPAELAAA